MIAVIFEVRIKPGRQDRYFSEAARLAPLLEGVEGFISVERFASLSEDGKYLSLSYWRDEQSVKRWRELAEHKAAQGYGRNELFDDYSITVGAVVRRYGMDDRAGAPA